MLNKMKVGTKIAGAFGCMLLVVLGLGLLALNRLSAVNDRALDVRDNWLPSVTRLGGLAAAIESSRRGELRYVVADTDALRGPARADVQNRIADVDARRAD